MPHLYFSLFQKWRTYHLQAILHKYFSNLPWTNLNFQILNVNICGIFHWDLVLMGMVWFSLLFSILFLITWFYFFFLEQLFPQIFSLISKSKKIAKKINFFFCSESTIKTSNLPYRLKTSISTFLWKMSFLYGRNRYQILY